MLLLLGFHKRNMFLLEKKKKGGIHSFLKGHCSASLFQNRKINSTLEMPCVPKSRDRRMMIRLHAALFYSSFFFTHLSLSQLVCTARYNWTLEVLQNASFHILLFAGFVKQSA